MRHFFLMLVLLVAEPSAFAEVFLGTGMISHNHGKAASNASSGTKPGYSENYVQLTASAIFPLYEGFNWSPEFRYAINSKDSPDQGASTKVFLLGVRAIYPVKFGFDLHLGPGALFYSISGKGGTIKLNNGAGTTTFGLPTQSATSRVLYWDPGLGWEMGQFRAELSLYITGLLNSSKRALNPALSASWRLL